MRGGAGWTEADREAEAEAEAVAEWGGGGWRRVGKGECVCRVEVRQVRRNVYQLGAAHWIPAVAAEWILGRQVRQSSCVWVYAGRHVRREGRRE